MGMWKKKNAYMTLEASLIMPMAVALIAFLMFLSFYLYSVCFLHQTAYIAALRGSLAMGEDAGEVAEKELDKLLDGRILPIKNLQKDVQVSGLFVGVKLEAELALPMTGILPVRESVWTIKAEEKALIRNAAGYIRLMRQVVS